MLRSLPVVALLAGWVVTAGAHHGANTQYDASIVFEITGIVTELKLENPHSHIYFDVTTDTGEIVPWRCGMRGATALRLAGWAEEMFSPGTEVTIKGMPDRVDSQLCYLMTVTFSDGRTVERYQELVE